LLVGCRELLALLFYTTMGPEVGLSNRNFSRLFCPNVFKFRLLTG